MPAVLEVELNDGTVLRAARDDYHGFHTNPFDWATARQKFDRVTRAFLTKTAADKIADVIADLDERPVSELTACLACVPRRRLTVCKS
jgi:2-methylcitrate dehydratase